MQALSVRFLRNSHSQQFSKTVPKYINKRFYTWRNISHYPSLAINQAFIGFPNKTYAFSTNSTQHSSNTDNNKDVNEDSQKETSGESDEELFEAADDETNEDTNGEISDQNTINLDEQQLKEQQQSTMQNIKDGMFSGFMSKLKTVAYGEGQPQETVLAFATQNSEILEDAEERILELEKEVKKWKDNLIRSHADIINLQNMKKKDIEREKLYANKGFARDMLEVNDALIMALKGIKESGKESNSNLKSIVDGIELTHRILLNTFSKHGIKKINSLDEIFDPSKHEALFQIETDEYPPNSVREVINDGFQIHDQILRSAKVGVTRAPVKPVEQISDDDEVVNEEENKNDDK